MTPIYRPKVWGGRALARLGKDLPPEELIGESWELADLHPSIDDARSVIRNGAWAGQTLHEVIAAHHEAIMGDVPLTAWDGFPLLLKYLDARDNLSVQVHPTEAFVRDHPDTHLKSEAWFIVHAEPDAVIYKGVRDDVSREAFAAHIADGTVVDDLIAVPVARGDCHYLPSGTCHALGAGVVVAEIQTPSDTTFRVYDWDRIGRELHIDEALACIDFGATPALPERSAPSSEVDGWRVERQVSTEFFAIDRVDVVDAIHKDVISDGRPRILMMISGVGELTGPSTMTTSVGPGSTVLLPAGLEDVRIRLEPSACLLDISIPGRLEPDST